METEFAHLRTPDHNIDRPALRKLVTTLWREHATGTAFIKALEAHKHTVALSDESHPFRLVNEWGRTSIRSGNYRCPETSGRTIERLTTPG